MKVSGSTVAIVTLFFSAAAYGVGDHERTTPIPRRPWQWSVDERLADRFDPAKVAHRAAAHDARVRRIPPQLGSGKPDRDNAPQRLINRISGDESPELFLPSELFDHLISLGFPPEGDHQDITRDLVQHKAAALGFGEDLWDRLEAVASPLIEFRRQEFARAMGRAGLQRAGKSDVSNEAILLCRVRADSLAAAEEEFGEEALLRLLYEAVAPNLSITYTVDGETAGRLRYIEGGCR